MSGHNPSSLNRGVHPAALDRRLFLKLSACVGSALMVGAALPVQRETNVTLTLETWRARPGAPLTITLHRLDNARQWPTGHVLHLLEIDEGGAVVRLLETLTPKALAPGHWTTQARAPGPDVPGVESFLVIAALVDPSGLVALSERAEIICTPFHAGL